MTVTTDWLKPASQIKGQDPLGVRAPCENIYTQLLPGITNVTDRADLYAFYPWLIWAFERHDGPLRKKPFFETLRRAECLLTLIGTWHTRETGEDLWLHGGGLVGRDRLGPALIELENGKSIKLSTFAALEDSGGYRYFKNKLGGLGQYYLGSLRDLGIVDGDAREIKYVTERGGVLADAFDKKIDRKLFFATLEQDRILVDALKALRRFCPCHLGSSEKEQGALVDLFFNRPGQFYELSSKNRRHTLALMLDLASKLEVTTRPATFGGFAVDTFRACTYTSALPSSEPWTPPTALLPVLRGWQIYGLNELLSIAIQGIFWAGLEELLHQGLLLNSSEDYQQWFTSTFDSNKLQTDLDDPFDDALERTRRTIPSLAAWTDERHEIQLGWRLGDVKNNFKSELKTFGVVRAALDLMLNLSVRTGSDDSAYIGFVQHRNYLNYYPINLDSFYNNVRNSWRNKSLHELLGWVAKDWGVSAHFRVALRKLRYESRDTFKIKPTDQGLEVIDAPVAVFSNPRLVQAIQILQDLGALEMTSEGFIVPSRGKQLLEESST